ncbi:MAG TPA: hypothetical protein VEC17_02785 [Candidatus Binatia bacterium]|nr:hypothetical protein [Candidatus Binatia bacterium]
MAGIKNYDDDRYDVQEGMVLLIRSIALSGVVRELDRNTETWVEDHARAIGGVFVAVLLALVLVWPLQALVIAACLWTYITIQALVMLSRETYKKIYARPNYFHRRNMASLRRCLFKGQCRNKRGRTRLHLLKLRMFWLAGKCFGNFGTGIILWPPVLGKNFVILWFSPLILVFRRLSANR